MTATLLALAACNTVQGLGEDISSVGRAGEEAID
nr:entericidin A/B family lipoprotein [Croceicoccus sp. Ery5]